MNRNSWSLTDSNELYGVKNWGAPYFFISDDGNIEVSPTGKGDPRINLKALIDDLRRRGIQPPILVRFNDILTARVQYLADAFRASIAEYDYTAGYQTVMPIKVNQQRHVVEQLVSQDAPYQLGLEAGSKPELLAAMTLLDNKDDALIVCNGYKDSEYITTALDAQRLGITTYIVVDRFAEIDLIIKLARSMGVRPNIGIRARLTTKGAGKWEKSSGEKSKFGLSPSELVSCIDHLRRAEMLDTLKMIHFHIGSQITAIRSVKDAAREAAHIYCHMRKLGATELKILDVGGGLAVDYDGSMTNFHSSKNYSVQEYANDIVSTLGDISSHHGEPHPKIFSESGRALAAHHSVLVFNVLGVHEYLDGRQLELAAPNESDHMVLHSMWEAFKTVNRRNVQEIFNDVVALKEESTTLFSHGVIDLETRAKVDDLFWITAHRIEDVVRSLDYVPDDLQGLERMLGDTFYCNFSVFQSLPDAWAVGQLFPITPLHRLNEEPTLQGVLADLTCDSDGKVDQFIDLRDVKSSIKLHAPNNEPYYLGAFLVGAYQETLGDLHNLFGDTNAVHVSVRADGSYRLEHVVEGDTVSEVLSYVEYDRADLIKRARAAAERAVRKGNMTFEESAAFMKRYVEGLDGYTYLEDDES